LASCLRLGVIVAGRAANHIEAGASLYDSRFIILGLLAVLLVFILAPFTVRIPVLVNVRAQGMFYYSCLANSVGEQFEIKWLKRSEPVSSSAVEAVDFSATTDLYSVVANAHQIRLLPVGVTAIRD